MTIIEVAKLVTDQKECHQIRERKNEPHRYDVAPVFPRQKRGRGWILLDLFTASAITAVANALSEPSRARYQDLELSRLITITWKLVK
jgi:hypothetical protein